MTGIECGKSRTHALLTPFRRFGERHPDFDYDPHPSVGQRVLRRAKQVSPSLTCTSWLLESNIALRSGS
jgi:hypothetical protein